MTPQKITTAAEAIRLMTDEAERQGADANDSNGIVRAIVAANLPVAVQFDAWFCVCCKLANRAAQKQGFENEVHRAYTVAKANIAARKAESVESRVSAALTAYVRQEVK